ncbi:MAG: hypothetical protein FRX49_07567 [Trebouxia sp. A1-2]|nr:MAG: hypothetical protein FRX49_07567 [Trebouxia sp. A1-2]
MGNSTAEHRQQRGYKRAWLYLDNFQLRTGEARESAFKRIPHLSVGHPKASSARSALDVVQLLRGELPNAPTEIMHSKFQT